MLIGRMVSAATIAVALISAVAGSTHDDQEIGGGGSSWSIDSSGQRLDISGSKTSSGSGGSTSPNTGSGGTRPVSDVEQREEAFQECVARRGGRAAGCGISVVTPAAPDGTDIPPITITDLATFAPDPSPLTGEPDNLGVAGLPTNFIAEAESHSQSGTLFGHPIHVRFTPASFTFRYGDDETRTTTTGGQSWDALDLPQFTPTDTSHTYAERGTYAARVDVAYTAEIDLGAGWFPVSGHLTTTGPATSIRIYEAHTALVARTCTEDPSAAGC